MEFLRSLFFYLLFYIWTIFYFVIFSQVRFFSKNFTVKIAEFWSVSVMKLTSRILLIDYEVEGKENIPDKPFIIASNHQSAWETFFLPIIFTRSVFILKKNLKNIPIFRSYFKKLGFIYVDKDNGFSSMKSLLKSASDRIDHGVYSIIIFPEGTRVRPGEKKELSPGVSAIYKSLSIPVLPIRLNSGEFWVNKRFIKKRGRILVKIHKPIMPGLNKEVLMKMLEEKL